MGSIVLGDNNPNPNLVLLSPSTIDAKNVCAPSPSLRIKKKIWGNILHN